MNLDTATGKLREFYSLQKRLPSYQEMCHLFGFASKKASFTLAQKLITAGILEKDVRGRLLPKKLFPQLQLLGTIKAGFASPAEQQLFETMSFDGFLVNKPEKSYLLRVSGDSMIDAGINHGDLVVIEKIESGHSPKEGSIVVAAIDGDFTLKYFQRIDGKPCLVPANKNYPVLYPEHTLEIFGVVVSVVRKYN